MTVVVLVVCMVGFLFLFLGGKGATGSHAGRLSEEREATSWMGQQMSFYINLYESCQ